MAKSKPPADKRVQVVWPKNGHVARPLKRDLQTWLDKGWQLTEPTKDALESAPTQEKDQ